MKNLHCFVVVLLLFGFVGAQTETVVNNAGATVVEFITQNAAGIPQTEVLLTIAGSSTSQALTTSSLTTSISHLQTTTALALTTSAPQQVGPVGQPASQGVAGGETPYTYTTTDANGETVVMEGIFTPTGPQTSLPVPTITGSVLGYSQWLSMIGTHTVPPNAAHRVSMSMATGWYYFAATILAGLVGGAWLIIL